MPEKPEQIEVGVKHGEFTPDERTPDDPWKAMLAVLKRISQQMDARRLAEELTAPVMSRATEVIGDRERALRWLGTPVRALGYATPISLLGTEAGQAQVLTVLDRLEHGIF